MTSVPAGVLDDLRRFDTPTVCNVIELFEIRPRSSGYMDSNIQAGFPELPPMVGFASTATFRALAPPRGTSVYAGLDEQLERFAEVDGPPVVVFQDLDQPSAAATFGEVMCTTYQSFGAAGLITSGSGRDLDQVRELQFPVFTGGTCCSHGHCHFVSLNVPVVVGGIAIYPGDLLHGDCNGVTTIPFEIADQIPQACEDFMAAEQHVLKYVRSGNPTPAGFREAREAMQADIGRLKQRLRPSR